VPAAASAYSAKSVDRGDHRLRMDGAVLAAGGGQGVEPGPGAPVVLGHGPQVCAVVAGQARQQRGECLAHAAGQRHVDRDPPADALAADVDLDHLDPVRIELPVGKVGAEHQQRVAVLHGR